MRRLLAGIALIALTAFTGVAAPVLAPPAPQCSTIGTGPGTDITIPFAVWSVPSFFCEQADKIFSNFAITGTIAPGTTLELQEQTLGPFDVHVVTLNGNFITAFGVSYDIAVDLTLSPARRIVRVSGDLSNPSDLGNPANVKTVFLESGTMVGSLTSTAGVPGTPIVTSTTALHVVDSYAPAGGAAVSISNTFVEADAPEVTSVLLIGSGLLMLARMRQRLA